MQQLKVYLAIAIALAAAFNLCQAYNQAFQEASDHTTIPLHSLAYQFAGLETVFKDIHTVGYYTDKDLNIPLAVAQYEQAQYMLAPTVLDLNHTQWHWIIFDCTSPQAAISAMKRLGVIPVKINHGIVLAYNPHGI